MARKLFRVKVVGLVLLLACAGAWSVQAANPHYQFADNGVCYWQGKSAFNYTPIIATSSTGKSVASFCSFQFHVHAYFWGSDGQWHYYEKTDYAATQIQVSYPYWTDNVYGYHEYFAMPGTQLQTNAY